MAANTERRGWRMSYEYGLSDVVREAALRFGAGFGESRRKMEKAAKKTANEMCKEVSKNCPTGATGETKKGFAVAADRMHGDFTPTMIVYSPKRYMLLHLLEFDHAAGQDRHRVEGKHFIEPAEKKYNEIFIDRIEQLYLKGLI